MTQMRFYCFCRIFILMAVAFFLVSCEQKQRNKSYTLNTALAFILKDLNSTCTTFGTLAGKSISSSSCLTHAKENAEVVLFKGGDNASIVKANFESKASLEFSSISTDLDEANFTYYETDSCPINEDITPGRPIPQESFTIVRGRNLTVVRTTAKKTF